MAEVDGVRELKNEDGTAELETVLPTLWLCDRIKVHVKW